MAVQPPTITFLGVISETFEPVSGFMRITLLDANDKKVAPSTFVSFPLQETVTLVKNNASKAVILLIDVKNKDGRQMVGSSIIEFSPFTQETCFILTFKEVIIPPKFECGINKCLAKQLVTINIIVGTAEITSCGGEDNTFTFTNSQNFIVPLGFSSVVATIIGGGGAGGSATAGIAGGGGGSGQTVTTPSTPVTPGSVITINVGRGGIANGNNPPEQIRSAVVINGVLTTASGGTDGGTGGTSGGSGGTGDYGGGGGAPSGTGGTGIKANGAPGTNDKGGDGAAPIPANVGKGGQTIILNPSETFFGGGGGGGTLSGKGGDGAGNDSPGNNAVPGSIFGAGGGGGNGFNTNTGANGANGAVQLVFS